MKRAIAIFLVIPWLAGCGTLIPKRVEFGQDKVRAFPEAKRGETEIQKQVARRAAESAQEVLQNALIVDAPPNVVEPAKDAAILTEVVSESIGAPSKSAPGDATAKALAQELRAAMAKFDQRLDEFKRGNNENAGKKIEGTGFLQIPYFVWLFVVAAMGFVGLIILAILWTAVKMFAMGNPPLQLATGAVQAGAGFFKRALGEVVSGGEEFKKSVMKKVKDPALQEEIKELFKVEHKQAQSKDTQQLVSAMTFRE